MNNIRTYINESFDELRNKMTWPTWQNLMSTTGVVLLATGVLVTLIFAMDSIANFVLKFIYKV